LFVCRAAFVAPPRPGSALPPVRLTLPDGTSLSSAHTDLNQVLSQVLHRAVTFAAAARSPHRGQHAVVAATVPTPWTGAPQAEAYWPDMDGLAYRDTVTVFALPEDTFFDCAVIHLLTTATLDRLRALYPQGRFAVRRFRPNVVVQASGSQEGFIEQAWIGHTLAIGAEVRLRVMGPCSRCVMTTLAQGDLPKDPGILRTAAQHSGMHVGVYASVLRGGTVRRGDTIQPI
jgi:uncharacterized protein YcbX